MGSINYPMLGFAFATAFFIMLIGVAISFGSLLGILLSILAVFIVMGFGFMTKKKMREKGGN